MISSSSFEFFHKEEVEIAKLSTFENSNKRIKGFVDARWTSSSSRVVTNRRGNFAKDRRMLWLPRLLSSQESMTRVCSSDCSKQSNSVDRLAMSLGHVKLSVLTSLQSGVR